jgi:carnitine O-acetyltransferase
MSAFTFKKYGREFIKSCKLSPDSFIQTAIQAAFYKIHGVPAAHYESASTRMFAEGRTECIRSCSVEAVDFSKALLDSDLSLQQKFKFMKKAVESHKSYAADAVQGLGVDRHLLGLKKIAIENGKNLPQLFMDEGYVQSSNFRLSTSQVNSHHATFL